MVSGSTASNFGTQRLVNIYALVDPRNGHCRYVGKTKNCISKRLSGHVNDSNRRQFENLPRFLWIRKLASLGLRPEVRLLEVVSAEDWIQAEQMWVSEMAARFELLNATSGGDGIHGLVHSAETKRKQSDAAKRRYQCSEEKRKTSEAVKAAFATEAGKIALSSAAKKRWADADYREKVAPKLAEASKSAEARARTASMHKGKVLSPETKAKISAANSGRKWTQEQKEKHSQKLTGRKHSPLTIEKMKASWASRRPSN